MSKLKTTKKHPNTRGPTLALSFRLKRETANRVKEVCGYLDWTRTEFFRTAIEDLLAEKERMIKEKIEMVSIFSNEVKTQTPDPTSPITTEKITESSDDFQEFVKLYTIFKNNKYNPTKYTH